MKDSFLNKKFNYCYKNSVSYLIGINFVIYFLLNYANISIKGLDLFYYISLIPQFFKHGYFWQIFTYMFVHVDTMHLLFNMYGLFLFGVMLERMIGTKEFLLFYFLCGMLSGLMGVFLYKPVGNIVMTIIGASGAIYALLFLVSVLAPNQRILLYFFIPLRMPIAVLVFIVIEIASQFLGSNPGTAHLIHLFGIAFAALYCIVRMRINPLKAWFGR